MKTKTTKIKLFGFIAAFAIITIGSVALSLTLASCDNGNNDNTGGGNKTPVAGDYTVGNLVQTAGSVTAVTVTAKSGKSPGAVSNIRYNNSTTVPQTVGTYAVTFDVAAATGWNAAANLSAGTLEVNNNQTPQASQYTIGNLSQTENYVSAVIVTPNTGASSGAVSNIRYNGETDIPQTAGYYPVTFDVAAAEGWNAATGLSAGTLYVSAGSSGGNQTPVADDYDISGNWEQLEGNVTGITVTPKDGKSTGAVTVRYTDQNGTSSSMIGFLRVGTYTVTFSVAAATGWNAASNLPAGTLTITENPNILNTPEKIIAYLENATEEGTLEDPIPLKLDIYNSLGILFTALNTAGKYVELDLSDCTLGNDTTFSLGSNATGKDKIVAITLPAGVTSFGQYAFYGCTGLTSIDIPDSVTSIGDGAFYNCTGLTSVTIPAGVTNINITNNTSATFFGCSGLTSFTVDPNNPNYASQDGILYNKDMKSLLLAPKGISGSVTIPDGVTSIGGYAFSGCTGLTSVTIPDGVTSIGRGAFQSCRGLTSVDIPASVTSIGDSAFSYCTSLRSVTVRSTTPPSLGEFVFSDNASGRTIYVPATSVTAYEAANGWRSYSISAIQ